jgi:flagellar protein FlgJ
MTQAGNVSNGLALDARSLDTLRLQAKQNPEQATRAVAQQFEAVFLQMVLKSMRDATPQDGPTDSDQTRMYTSMLDQQIAQSLSAKGIGLADVMLRQLRRSQPAAPSDTSAVPLAPLPAPSKPAEAKTGGPVASQNFLSRMKEHAIAASNATGIPARFLLGHAALESGWGKAEIRTADGSPSHNLFGIKAGRNWKGATVDVTTTEYVDGAPRKMVQTFRAYASYAQAFQDYASLMKNSPRYAAVLKQSDGAGFAQGLQRAGYATDPRYAEKLTGILNGASMRQSLVA